MSTQIIKENCQNLIIKKSFSFFFFSKKKYIFQKVESSSLHPMSSKS